MNFLNKEEAWLVLLCSTTFGKWYAVIIQRRVRSIMISILQRSFPRGELVKAYNVTIQFPRKGSFDLTRRTWATFWEPGRWQSLRKRRGKPWKLASSICVHPRSLYECRHSTIRDILRTPRGQPLLKFGVQMSWNPAWNPWNLCNLCDP